MSVLTDRLFESSVARGIPLSMHIDLTMRCNEKCIHCYRVVESRPELSTDELRHLLDELADLGTLYVTFSGGEVFLRPDLFAVIEHAKARRFDVRLKSNALLVTEASARRLRALGVRQVDVSLYSADAAVHDSVTLVPRSLERTLEGVAHLKAAGVGVKLNCPLMTVNVSGYRAVRELADRLEVAWGFDPMITAKNDGDTAPVMLRIGGRDLRRILLDPELGLDPGPAEGPVVRADIDEIPCGAGHNAGYVSAYGDVSPCVAMPIVCGNVRDEPFAEIWRRSPEMLRVRSIRIRDLHTCSGCAAGRFCARCPGQAVVENGDLYGPSTAACEHALVAAEAAGSTAVPASFVSLRALARG
ncbi:MAG TPA: radical SAM protein [Methylomirabilota bacterium]|nr:radical SAM protein [Methylomirabilota bacterium]